MTTGNEKIKIIKELINDWERQFSCLEPTHIIKAEVVLRNIIEVAEIE